MEKKLKKEIPKNETSSNKKRTRKEILPDKQREKMKGYWLNLAKKSKAQNEEEKSKTKSDKFSLLVQSESCSANNSCQIEGMNVLPNEKIICQVADKLASEPIRLKPEKVNCLSGLKVKPRIRDKPS